MAILQTRRLRPRTSQQFPQLPGQPSPFPVDQEEENQFPQAPQFRPFQASSSPLDPQITQLRGQLRGFRGPSRFQYQEDPRYSNFINQLQGRIGEFESRTQDVLSRLQQPEAPFAFSDPRYGELRDLISTIQQGKGVGPIDVQSDPAAAAYRTARERQGLRERSQLAERLAATGQLRTGAADIGLLAPAGEAGRDIAGFEANLANQRRGEILGQRLAGAQLGLEDIAGARSAALGAYQANRQNRLAALQTELGGLQAGAPYGALTGVLGAAQGARGQAFGEYQAREAGRQAAFGSEQDALRARLAELTGEREATREFGFRTNEANRRAQLEAFEAAAKRARETEGLETGKVQRDILKEELEERKAGRQKREKEGEVPSGGLHVKRKKSKRFEF